MNAEALIRATPRRTSRSATALLERGLVGRVDEVHAPGGAIPERALDLVDRPLDALEGEAGGAEEAEHPGLRHGDHHPRRGDAVGHLPGDVREAHAVHLARTSDRRATRGRARAASPAAGDRRPGRPAAARTRRQAPARRPRSPRRGRRAPARAPASARPRARAPPTRALLPLVPSSYRCPMQGRHGRVARSWQYGWQCHQTVGRGVVE